jgi:hypothetical protein
MLPLPVHQLGLSYLGLEVRATHKANDVLIWYDLSIANYGLIFTCSMKTSLTLSTDTIYIYISIYLISMGCIYLPWGMGFNPLHSHHLYLYIHLWVSPTCSLRGVGF